MTNARGWLGYEAFSSRPAVLGSCVSAVILEDYETTIRLLNSGLQANPGHEVLLNNMAYSKACIGELGAAQRFLDAITADDSEPAAVFKTATTGPTKYRQGAIARGRELYSLAAKKAGSVDQGLHLKNVMIVWDFEGARAAGMLSEGILAEAKESAAKEQDARGEVLIARAQKLLSAGRVEPES